MLDPISRVSIVVLGGLCIAAASALAPLRARGAVDSVLTMPQFAANGRARAPEQAAAVNIERDPFGEPLTPADVPSDSLQGAPSADVGPLPTNLHSDTIPAVPAGASTLAHPATNITAIVTGARPYALIEINGVHLLKGIHDRIDGIAIVAIDLSGIHLADGSFIMAHLEGQR